VRRTLRNRARYETANNSYARGIVLTLANAAISTGPNLQVKTPNEPLNDQIESSFNEWSELINLDEKLRVMRQARAVDGETFGLLFTNPRIEHDVQLDLRLIECDQIADPYGAALTPPDGPRHVDGIDFDTFGNPLTYSLLHEHPGSTNASSYNTGATAIPARFMLHWYRQDRPGQARGVSELTPALPLFALLRRYTLATVAAAELAADYAAVLETDQPPSEDQPYGLPPDGEAKYGYGTTTPGLPIEPRTMAFLPEGWKLSQFKAEQPTTAHPAFVEQTLNEIARCLEMPYAVAAGNSSGYNYSSGRLDFQVFGRAIAILRRELQCAVLRRIFESWLDEAATIGLFRGLPARFTPIQWHWPSVPHVDPQKEAQAQQIRLLNLTTTWADECAADGRDWQTVFDQRAREVKRMTQLGITSAALPEERPESAPPPEEPNVPDDANEEPDADQEVPGEEPDEEIPADANDDD
jgi:lambda family phage portal protein